MTKSVVATSSASEPSDANAPPLTDATLQEGVDYLVERDPALTAIVERLGVPPLWAREPGFPSLLLIILEQQVSLASARAAFDRLVEVVQPLTPARLLEQDDATLRATGFSRQKASYARHLALALYKGELDLAALAHLDSAAVRRQLLQIKGIGPWTADIYLLMVLRRRDVLPVGDLALAVAVQEIRQLETRPSPEQLRTIGQAWRPWRSVAARILWNHYLNR